MAVAQNRGNPEFQQQQHTPPPPQRNERWATSAARGSDSRAATPLRTLGSANADPGESQPSSSASLQQTTNSTRLRSIPRLRSQLPIPASDPGVEGASLSSEVQHSYQLRSRIPRPPNAFMLSAHEKWRSVAAENPNENNQHVSSLLGKLWRSLSVANKEPYRRKPAASADVHRRKHPECVHNPREAQRRKMQARRTKAISGKLKNGTSGDQQQQASISMAVAQDRGTS
nr:transcription factor SOX-18-like [Dermacentor andersoni]